MSVFDGKGRLRTFSSIVKLRNFELSRKKRRRGRPRKVYYTLSGLLFGAARTLHNIIRTWAGCVAHLGMGAMRRPEYEMSEKYRLPRLSFFINLPNLGEVL